MTEQEFYYGLLALFTGVIGYFFGYVVGRVRRECGDNFDRE